MDIDLGLMNLAKKAEQILGQPTAVLDCRRQTSMDLHNQHGPRLNITTSKSTLPSRSNIPNTASSTTVHNQSLSQSVNTVTSDSSNGKNKRSVTVEHLVPLILQLVAAPKLMKFPEMISRHRSNSKSIENILESRERHLFYIEKVLFNSVMMRMKRMMMIIIILLLLEIQRQY
jgi:hypothetical protein